MLVTCQNCHRVYKVADDSLENGELTFKCQICGFTWTTLLEQDLPPQKEDITSSEESSQKETNELTVEEVETPSVEEIPSLSENEASMPIENAFNNVSVDIPVAEVEENTSTEKQPDNQPIQSDISEPTPQETLVTEPTVASLDETLSQIVDTLTEYTPSQNHTEVLSTNTAIEESMANIPNLEDFEEMLQQKDYSRFAPKEEEEQSLQPQENNPLPSPFEREEPETPTSFIDPERKEPMPIAQDFPILEIPSEETLTNEIPQLKEEPLLPIRKKGNIFWGLVGYLLFLLVFGGIILWLGEPLLKRFFPAITPFYDRSHEIYDKISEKIVSMDSMQYVHAIYKKIDIRTKNVGKGLNFEKIQTHAGYENDILTLNISGTIINESSEEKTIPFLYFVIYDKNGNELQNLTNVTKKETLEANTSLSFTGKISPLHPDSARLDVTFRKE